jgi:hypothetical protein
MLTSMKPLPITHSAMSHPHCRRQGPLDNTWRSLHHHCCRPPPSLSLSATAAIVAIMGLGVAWCHLPPLSSSSLLSTTTATLLPTTESVPPLFSSPPVAVSPSPPSQLLMVPSWTGIRHRHPPVQCRECRSRPRPPCQKTGLLHQRRHHCHHNALVSSPAASVGPSFASWAASASRAT